MQLSTTLQKMKYGPMTKPLVLAVGFMLFPLVGQAQDALYIDPTGLVGLGLNAPERQLHIRGSSAQIRVDRPVDSSSFQLVRLSADSAVVWKSFVFGVNATGVDSGSFFIRDNGTATTGTTERVRMLIDNAGNVTFQGSVTTPDLIETSSARYKTDVATLSDAGESLKKLRGVSFAWKDSGTKSLGFIAEEVAQVFPELVKFDAATGQAEGVHYSALTAVLTEAYKEQQAQLAAQQSELLAYRSLFAAQQAQVSQLQDRLDRIDIRQAKLDDSVCVAPVRFAINDPGPAQLNP
jgi:hypothetical protein